MDSLIYNKRFWEKLCYKNEGIHWYHCHTTFLWKINFTLVWRLISALIWDISDQWNCSDSRDFREKQIDISRFLKPYVPKSCVILTRDKKSPVRSKPSCFFGRLGVWVTIRSLLISPSLSSSLLLSSLKFKNSILIFLESQAFKIQFFFIEISI